VKKVARARAAPLSSPHRTGQEGRAARQLQPPQITGDYVSHRADQRQYQMESIVGNFLAEPLSYCFANIIFSGPVIKP
jgi:hypothetical protein